MACMMLNCTTRKQVEKVLPLFFIRWPTPSCFLTADRQEVSNLITPLGFMNRRTQRLFEMSYAYVNTNWKHALELPGIGEYASRAWEIFFQNKLGEHPPKDGALVKYCHWRKKLETKNE